MGEDDGGMMLREVREGTEEERKEGRKNDWEGRRGEERRRGKEW